MGGGGCWGEAYDKRWRVDAGGNVIIGGFHSREKSTGGFMNKQAALRCACGNTVHLVPSVPGGGSGEGIRKVTGFHLSWDIFSPFVLFYSVLKQKHMDGRVFDVAYC